jgi:hypothetical protein
MNRAMCCAIALMLLTPLGCKNAEGEGAGASSASISGPLTMLPQYGSRAPRTCSKVMSPPSVAQAAVLVQCAMEADSAFGVGLVQDVKIEIGKPRKFIYATDAGMPGIDVDALVYPLQGDYSAYLCRTINNMSPAGANCTKTVNTATDGWCYKTSFGDWKCRMHANSAMGVQGKPAPTTF